MIGHGHAPAVAGLPAVSAAPATTPAAITHHACNGRVTASSSGPDCTSASPPATPPGSS
ncbi:hypothetical protein ACFQ0T_29640 [Kitasatospora gansuensis]